MLIALLFPFLAAALLALPVREKRDLIVRLSALVPLGLLSFFIYNSQQTPTMQRNAWLRDMPVSLDLYFDGLSFLFILLITGIGTAIFVYAGAYMKGHAYSQRLMAFLMLFMGAMLGVVLSDNLIALFVFWELTSISSFFLIGFNNENAASRKSALTALAVTGSGGLVMLIGFIGLGEVAGTYSIQEIIAQRDAVVNHTAYGWITGLILFGAITKSAQFPFHFWLPGAMKAPTPVSAYLHSATMVKAGIYLIARLTPALGDTPFWNQTLLVLGGVTMLYAAFQSLFHKDMKSILAYSTVSALGILVFLLGIGTSASILAASVFILVHGLYKATLFLVTGIVDHETGSRDVSQLSGLRKVMLPVAIAGLLAAISNAGIPPSFGFIGKDLIYEATELKGHLLTALAVLTNIFLLVAGFLAGWKPFAGPLQPEHQKVHLPEMAMWLPPLLLATLGIVFGLFPQLIEKTIVAPVFQSISGTAFTGHLALWHGFNFVLLLSSITIVGGLVLYFIIKPSTSLNSFIVKSEKFGPKVILTGIANGFDLFARLYTKFFQNGYLRYYIIFIMLTLIGLLGFEMWHYTTLETNNRLATEVTFYEGVTILILLVSVVIIVFSQSRLASVAALGVMGLAICIVFVFYSAPDLAMTQFTIDTLTVILFVLVLYKLPKFIPLRFTLHHLRDAIIALGFGALISILTLEVLTKNVNREISEFYAANSYVLAKGKNVVNVILVDFRGADTIVEIAVLSIAAIGVFSLLKLRLPKKERIE